MAADDPERPDRPDYKVYRSGSARKGKDRSKSAEPKGKSTKAKRPAASDGDDPSYSVYKSSRNPLAKVGGLSLAGLRDKLPGRGGDGGSRSSGSGAGTPTWRRVLRYALIGAGLWLLLSVVLFAVSAQLQSGKLADAAGSELGGNPLLVASPQTILVIGTDARPEATGAVEAETRTKCIDQGASGKAPSADCTGFRADTLLLVRAGGGSFEKLSIPRDTLSVIPDQGEAKINSAFASGGAALQIKTVESFLGIDVDHVVLLDFQGFAEFIDAIGGVKVDVGTRVKSKVDGGSSQGGITLKLEKGETTLDGDRALAYARTRNNERNRNETDVDRARRQQEVLTGIKNRLTSPWRAPINFLRGPLIAWNAPKAMVTDMGPLTLPQLGMALAIAGDSGTKILGRRNSTGTAAGNIAIPVEECERAVRRFLGEPGPRPPNCSPPA